MARVFKRLLRFERAVRMDGMFVGNGEVLKANMAVVKVVQGGFSWNCQCLVVVEGTKSVPA